LAETGAKVTLLERGMIGHEASWAGGGILSPLYPWHYPDAVNQLARWSQQHYPQLMATLHQNTGIDPEWTQSGLLILDAEETPAAMDWAGVYGGQVFAVDAETIHELEPAVAATGKGLWLPEVAQVRNPRLMRALKADLLAQGVTLVENTEVSHLLVKQDRIAGVRTLYSELTAQNVVIACGAWSAALVKGLGRELDIVPVRGQMLLYKTEPGTLKRIVLSQGHYAIPRLDGRILVGSTMEEVGFDKAVTHEAREDLAAVARTLVPALAQAELETHWAGLRPGSPSGIPFIGPHPNMAGLYINAGHYRNGVVMAPASARLLADMVLGRPPALDPHPYDLTARATAA
jgi:glycine oxidase